MQIGKLYYYFRYTLPYLYHVYISTPITHDDMTHMKQYSNEMWIFVFENKNCKSHWIRWMHFISYFFSLGYKCHLKNNVFFCSFLGCQRIFTEIKCKTGKQVDGFTGKKKFFLAFSIRFGSDEDESEFYDVIKCTQRTKVKPYRISCGVLFFLFSHAHTGSSWLSIFLIHPAPNIVSNHSHCIVVALNLRTREAKKKIFNEWESVCRRCQLQQYHAYRARSFVLFFLSVYAFHRSRGPQHAPVPHSHSVYVPVRACTCLCVCKRALCSTYSPNVT